MDTAISQTPDVSGKIIPTASPSTIEVTVSKEVLNGKFDEYWQEVKDRLHPDLVKSAMKGGYRELKRARVVKAAGGPAVFYRTVIGKVVYDYMATKDRQPISYDEFQLFEGIEGSTNATITASVYLEPEVAWPGEIPGIKTPIKVKCPKIPENIVDQLVQSELDKSQDSKAVVADTEPNASVNTGNLVEVTCKTIIDGTEWAPGCIDHNRWLVDDTKFKEPAILANIIGMLAGETKTFTIKMGDKMEDVAGKDAIVTVTVQKISTRTVPAIDDDLAKVFNKTSLEAWKKELFENFKLRVDTDKNRFLINAAITSLITPQNVSISPIPDPWLISKASIIYDEQRNQVRTEEDLLKKFEQAQTPSGKLVRTKLELIEYFAGLAADDLIVDLVLKSWGKIKGIPGYTAIDNLSAYSNTVRQEMLASIEAEYVENNPCNNCSEEGCETCQKKEV